MDSRTGRDGRAIEELGHYDPMVRNTDARTVLKVSRIRYWLSVGAQPSEKVASLLRRAKVAKPAPGEDWQVDEPTPVAAAGAGAGAGTGAAATPTPSSTAPTAPVGGPADSPSPATS